MKKSLIYFPILLFYMLFLFSCTQGKKITKINSEEDFFLKPPTSLILSKESCNCENSNTYRYMILYGKTNWNEESCDYYYSRFFFRSADSLKIQLLSELLDAAKDTSICCIPVRNYLTKYSTAKPSSQNYNLQIDALYHFNFITFAAAARNFAPYPVLYDTITKKEINDDVQKINEVIYIYKEWFHNESKKGFANYNIPLYNTRYRWFGGVNKDWIFNSLPGHPQVDNLGVPKVD